MSFNKQKLAKRDTAEVLKLLFALDPEQFRVKCLTGLDLDIESESDLEELIVMIESGEIEFDMDSFLNSFIITPEQIKNL